MDQLKTDTRRKIIHIDMDAFYASVEQRDFPEYRGKPLAVGGKPGARGVVATASYEARKFGVRSAMASSKALQLCPNIIFVYPRFDVYKAVSSQIRSIFERYTDLIEPLSLDEAFLDVSEDKLGIGSAIEIARQIKQSIQDELKLTASAGISSNKFVAKIASDINKPDGLTFIGPSKIEAFVAQLPVDRFFGVGKVTAEKMRKMGIFSGADLKRLSQQELTTHFGKAGQFYYQIVRGIDDREIQPHRELKSLGAEDTFARDLTSVTEMHGELEKIAATVHQRLLKKQVKGRTITLKVKYADFSQVTRNLSTNTPTNNLEQILETAKNLLQKVDLEDRPVRLLGIQISNFGIPELRTGPPEQLNLFD
jgi:DNA polymerase IV